MVAVLIKLLVPVIGFYYFQRWFRNLLNVNHPLPRNPSPKKPPEPRGGKHQVIEICPECGNVEEAGHKCY